MIDSSVDKTQKTEDIEHKSSKQQNQEHSLHVQNTDLDGTQNELDAALAYNEKLMPS